MRRRTPSEIKAYGDGYAEAYKQFCHLLKNHDVNKAMRKMKIFADAVALTVETATDGYAEPKDEPTISKMEQVDKDINVRSKTEPQTCSVNGRPYDCGNCEYHKCTADEPQTNKEIVLDPSFAELSDEQFVEAMKLIEPQTDCPWK